ncbi:MAG: hypothetical protein AAGA56_17925 [Myxococcota bacterium]
MQQPDLDEALVTRLAERASQLDGGDESEDAPLLEEFNRLAGTSRKFADFQGIYGAEDHADYVRRVLTIQLTDAQPELTRDDLVAMFAKLLANVTDDAYITYVATTIEKTFGDAQVSDLVFWPGEYFGDGDHSRELTPGMMADAVLERHAKRRGV